MDHIFILDGGHYFTLAALIGSGVGIILIGVSISRSFYGIKRSRQTSKPDEVAGDWLIIEKYAKRKAYGRMFLFSVTLVFFALLWQNAYVRFSSIQINASSIKLGYFLHQDVSFEQSQVVTLQIMSEQNGGHLVLATKDGKSFRSVLVKDASVLQKIKNLAQINQQDKIIEEGAYKSAAIMAHLK